MRRRRKTTYAGLVLPGKRRRAKVVVKLVYGKKKKHKKSKSKGNALDKIAVSASKIPVIGALI